MKLLALAVVVVDVHCYYTVRLSVFELFVHVVFELTLTQAS